MRILALSHLFPNSLRKTQGLFVRERLRHMAALAEVHVVAPVPWFPFPGLFPRYAGGASVERERTHGGLMSSHPLFPILPGLHVATALAYALSLLFRPSFRRRLRRADVLDVHWTFPDAFAAALLAALFRKPYTVTVRGHEAFYAGQGRLREALVRLSLKRAAGVIAVSEELRRRTLAVTGRDPSGVRTVANGVDTARFRPRDRAGSRRTLGIPPEARLVLSVGRVSPGKGYHHLVRSLPALLREQPEALLAVVGDADPEGGAAYLASLKAEADALGVSARVLFPGGASPEVLADWYGACDVFCLASASEGSPNVVLEALASGRPVVATAVGDVPETLSDPGLGLVVDRAAADFVPPLASALNTAWDEEYIFHKMQDRGWDRCAGRALEAIGGFLR